MTWGRWGGKAPLSVLWQGSGREGRQPFLLLVCSSWSPQGPWGSQASSLAQAGKRKTSPNVVSTVDDGPWARSGEQVPLCSPESLGASAPLMCTVLSWLWHWELCDLG